MNHDMDILLTLLLKEVGSIIIAEEDIENFDPRRYEIVTKEVAAGVQVTMNVIPTLEEKMTELLTTAGVDNASALSKSVLVAMDMNPNQTSRPARRASIERGRP